MLQLIARHLRHTPKCHSGGKFRTFPPLLSHVCLPALSFDAYGAQASSVIYSLIETAKENGLDPYRYLTWVLTNAPILAAKGDGWADDLLPSNAPAECRTICKN